MATPNPSYQYRSSPLRELLTERRPPPGMSQGGFFARFPVTSSIGALLLIFYALEYHLGGPGDMSVQIRLGAVRQDLVFQRLELYRLFCATFLHANLLHIGLNGFAFIQLGILCELVYGRWRYLATYLLSALGGTLLSATFLPLPSVGASGAILGLAGLLMGTCWYGAEPWRTDLRNLLGQRLVWAVVLTFALGIGLQVFLVPIIDNFGHLGGLLTGLAMAAWQRRAGAPASKPLRALAVVLALACAGSFVWMALDGPRSAQRSEDDMVAAQARMMQDDPGLISTLAPTVTLYYSEAHLDAETARISELWYQHAPQDAEAQNQMAWFLVTRPRVSQRDPQRALPLVQAAVQSAEAAARDAWGAGYAQLATLAAVLDTRAVVLRALGRDAEALDDEERAEGFWRRLIREQAGQEAALVPLLYQSYQRRGDPRALATLGRWLHLTPQDDRGQVALSEVFLRMGAGAIGLWLPIVHASADALERQGAARSLPGRYRLAALIGAEARLLLAQGRGPQAAARASQALELLRKDQAPQLRAQLTPLLTPDSPPG